MRESALQTVESFTVKNVAAVVIDAVQGARALLRK
jgi:hypothetical protein